MELVNLKVSFISRIIKPVLLSLGFLILWNFALFYLLKDKSIFLLILLTIPISYISIYEVIKSYNEGKFFLEYLSINPEFETCHVRCVKKNKLYKELDASLNKIKATLKAIPGNPTTTYKLIVYIDNILFIEQYESIYFTRTMMKEIIFNLNPQFAKVYFKNNSWRNIPR